MAQTTAHLVTITPEAEKLIAYIARVSNPKNQENENFTGLLKYCIRNKHWSIFEQAHMTIEVETSLAIATQVLRHRSFCFQQFSQRYANVKDLEDMFMEVELRRQDDKNRQNSIDDLPEEVVAAFMARINKLFADSKELYLDMVNAGVAKECARFVLPQATKTKMYITGNIRSWIHYLDLRGENGTQKEHRLVAGKCRLLFCKELPAIAEALGWL